MEALAAQGQKLDGATYAERVEQVTHGSGKHATTEERKTIVVGVREVPCEWWRKGGSSSEANKKDFVPKQLNATVVLRWDGAPQNAEREVVILTTDPSADPFVAFDSYDDRSLIENTCNREAKESWFLERHPKRSEAGMRVHAYFVLMCMSLTTAFRMHQQKADAAELQGQRTGITRYRRALEARDRDKVAVFADGHYGIFRNSEVMQLLGAVVRDRALIGESIPIVLARYGIAAANTA